MQLLTVYVLMKYENINVIITINELIIVYFISINFLVQIYFFLYM